MQWSVLFVPARELQQLPPRSNICLPDNMHSCTRHYLSIRVSHGRCCALWRNWKEICQREEVAHRGSLAFQFDYDNYFSQSARFSLQSLNFSEWALGKQAHALAWAFVLYLMWLQESTRAIAFQCPEGL